MDRIIVMSANDLTHFVLKMWSNQTKLMGLMFNS